MNDLDLKKLNDIIPMDDLNWVEKDDKFCLISEEEIDSVIKTCIESDITELDDIEKVIRFVEDKISGKLLVNAIFQQRVKLVLIGDEIGFAKKDD